MNVGILYSVSKAHPQLSKDLLDAVKLCLKQQKVKDEVELTVESIGLGGAEKEVYEKAERLLVIEKVDMLAAFVDLRTLAFIEPLLYSSGKPVIIINAGANIPHNWVPQPNTAFLTLRHAFLCALAGGDAGKEREDGILATSFYDCGYFHTASMVNAFTAKGGSIKFNYINKQLYNDAFHIDELSEELKKHGTAPALLCIYDELPASLFYNGLNDLEAAKDADLYVSPMMLEPVALEGMGSTFQYNVSGYMPWDKENEMPENIEFINLFYKSLGRAPGMIALLGWELGLLISRITSLPGNTSGGEVMNALRNIVFQSPRGGLMLDNNTNYFIAPVISCKARTGRGQMEKQQPDMRSEDWAAFSLVPVEGMNSGWTNTYLCY